MKKSHVPVMLKEVMAYLVDDTIEDKLVVDCTFGAGGYSEAFLARGARVIALDRDPDAVKRAEILQQQYGDKFTIINTTFGNLADLNIIDPQIIVLDIGVSSMQLDEARRGFSFQKPGPLDMRMGDSAISAADVVNNYAVEDLTQILKYYGEEKHAKKIAIMIENYRKKQPFTTTTELSNAIEHILPKRYFEKIHPATKTFQAIRIYVNDELAELHKVLLAAEKILPKGGKLGVVTFHSLEDKIVKGFLRRRSQKTAISRYVPQIDDYSLSFDVPYKKAITPSPEEFSRNKRARSAKFRYAIRSAACPLPSCEPLYKSVQIS